MGFDSTPTRTKLVIHEPVVTDPDERERIANAALSGGIRTKVAVDPVKAVGRK